MSQEDKNLNAFISTVEGLYQPVPGGRPTENGFDRDFQELKKLSSELKKSEEHKGLTGQKPENKKKNRYKDITPFDETRVKLTVTNNDPFSDYINASFIKGAEGHQNYIASQGPLPHTVLDFWQMLWQYNVTVIVMVCREIELGKKKCERYWADQDDPKNFGGITVSLNDKQDLSDGYCLRTIKAQKGGETRYIQQFHYTSWPDHGVPKTCFEIITLINHVRSVQSYSQDENTPLCVHCSAGCGRTGAVLALDFFRNMLETKTVRPGLKMFDVISEMRKQRPAIVQTKDQYEFVNAAVVEMFRIYMQTRSVSYQEFSVGYQGEQYVNVNIGSEDKGKDKRNGVGPPRPMTLLPSYENVDLRNRPKPNSDSIGNETAKLSSLEDYPDNPPPAKPPLRPVSVLLPEPSSNAHHTNSARKQSMPVVLTPPKTNQKQSTPTKITKKGPIIPMTKPRTPNANNMSLSSSRPASGSPVPTGKEGAKPPPAAGKPKPNKPEPPSKNISTAPALKSPGAIPKAIGEVKKKAPIKPKRSIRIKSSEGSSNSASSSAAGANKPTATNNFQKYNKRNVYSDITINEIDGDPHRIVESQYETFPDNNAIPRSNSTASVDRIPASNASSGPPKLPARTKESKMFLSESPPDLPTRTEESYQTIEVEDSIAQEYEAVDTTSLPIPVAKSSDADTGRRQSNTSNAGTTSGTNFLTAKAKNMFEKTTNAFSKVSSSMSKNSEEDSTGSPATTLENRTPTYAPAPVVYGGQDMSFGKRLVKKVRGGRKLK